VKNRRQAAHLTKPDATNIDKTLVAELHKYFQQERTADAKLADALAALKSTGG
jgi:hypothetical protein